MSDLAKRLRAAAHWLGWPELLIYYAKATLLFALLGIIIAVVRAAWGI